MDTKEGHPVVGSLKMSVLIITTIMAITAPTHEIAPIKDAIFKGASEKLIMPSIEYLNKLQNDQDV